MYGAMRERAPASTQITGISAAILITALLGYALANGLHLDITRMVEKTITFTPLIEEKIQPEPRKDILLDGSADERLPIPTLLPPTDKFEVEPDRIIGRTDTSPVVGSGTESGTGNATVPAPVRTRPSLLTRDPPPYPAAAKRRQAEGDTSLEVCVSAAGRVTSASLAGSSGHSDLDDAALKWIRNGRFTPGELDGVAQSVCGHNVIYEWNLEIIRK
jgi:periplasmic protein TonB